MAMRQVDPRIKASRRLFLKSAATVAPAAALVAGGITLDAKSAWAAAASLSPQVMATLTQMARDIYPHDQIGDAFYRKAVAHWDADAAGSAATQSLIANGVATLDSEAKARFGSAYLDVAAESDRLVLLQAIEPDPFFKAVRGDLIVSLYGQNDLWAKFGYEGSSAQLGGYIHRGFNDIDWLPEA